MANSNGPSASSSSRGRRDDTSSSDTVIVPQDSGRSPDKNAVSSRELQYMIRPKQDRSLNPLAYSMNFNSDAVKKAIDDLPGVEFVRRVRHSSLNALSVSSSPSEDIVVVRAANPERAGHLEALAQRNPNIHIERDHILNHLGSFRPLYVGVPGVPNQVNLAATSVAFEISSPSGQPLSNAEVVVYGSLGAESRGKTDQAGRCDIQVPAGSLNQSAALYIKPAANYWEQFVERPQLDANAVNAIVLQPLSSYAPAGFDEQKQGPFFGWGQKIMGALGLSSSNLDGAGVRIAIIDSGCDNTHPALSHVAIGRDYTKLDDDHQPDQQSWTDDAITHGTHCAGIITGNGRNGHIRGFAPGAEIHILKVFPGGAFNNLVAAINYCISEQMHVVNCSLGGDVDSDFVARSVSRAREAGVAMFVAAGNSGAAVQFPARMPGVLCVSAIGQRGRVPDYTYHARTSPPDVKLADGEVYPASFTCRGPEVKACGPGVGVISAVPGGYAAWDGTSMATPHLTGVGALLAAHHPDLCQAASRDANWVDRLFALVVAIAKPVGLSPDLGGVGLPVLAPDLVQSTDNVQQFGQEAKISQSDVEEIVKSVIASLPKLRRDSHAS